MEKFKKNKNGITMIALVITIIILLILAGISIAMLTGENGILKKANTAKIETTRTGEEEQIKLAYNSAMTEKLGTGEVLAEDINGQFKNNSTNATAKAEENGDIKVTFNDTLNQYIIGKNGKITRLDEKGETDNSTNSNDTISNEKVEQLEATVLALQQKVQKLEEKSNNYKHKTYTGGFTIPKKSTDNAGFFNIDTIKIEKDCKLLVTSWMQLTTGGLAEQISSQIYLSRDGKRIQQSWVGNSYPRSGAQIATFVFDCKLGDEIVFRCWNWNTTDIKIPSAQIVMQEI